MYFQHDLWDFETLVPQSITYQKQFAANFVISEPYSGCGMSVLLHVYLLCEPFCGILCAGMVGWVLWHIKTL
jgi:hypothetical protein